MQRLLIILGIALLVAGLLWPWLSRLPLGRLPGDLVIDRPGLRVYFPFMTLLIISIVLSVIAWFFRR